MVVYFTLPTIEYELQWFYIFTFDIIIIFYNVGNSMHSKWCLIAVLIWISLLSNFLYYFWLFVTLLAFVYCFKSSCLPVSSFAQLIWWFLFTSKINRIILFQIWIFGSFSVLEFLICFEIIVCNLFWGKTFLPYFSSPSFFSFCIICSERDIQ